MGSSATASAPVDAGVVVVDAGVVAVDAGTSLGLINPGFEAGLTGWTVTGMGGVMVDPNGHVGAALSLAFNGSMTAVVKQQLQAPGPGTLKLTAWYRNPSIVSASQGVTVQAEDVLLVGGGLKYLDCSASASTAWTQVTCDLTAFAGKLVSINLYSPNPVVLDDLVFTAVPFAASAGVVIVDAGTAERPQLANSGFETGATDWTFSGDATVTDGGARTGQAKLSFTSSTDPMGYGPGGNAVTQVIAPTSVPITVTAYVRGTVASVSNSLRLMVSTPGAGTGGCGGWFATDGSWGKVTCAFDASPIARTLKVDAYAATTQVLTVDDVVIDPITNGSFEYGLVAWGSVGTTSTAAPSLDASGNATLRPSFGSPAVLTQAFTRRAWFSTLSVGHRWESACQSCNASALVLTLSSPGFPTVRQQLSSFKAVGWYNSSVSLGSFPVGAPVTLTLRADTGLAPNTTESFVVDAIQFY